MGAFTDPTAPEAESGAMPGTPVERAAPGRFVATGLRSLGRVVRLGARSTGILLTDAATGVSRCEKRWYRAGSSSRSRSGPPS